MALSTPPPIPQRGDRATFGDRLDAFLRWLGGFVTEFNTAIAALSSWLAGGAFSIPYTLTSSNQGIATDAGGHIYFSASTMYFDAKDSRGVSVLPLLLELNASSSTVKGYVKLVAQNDPTKWQDFAVTGYNQDASLLYGIANVAPVGGSNGTASPFTVGDAVLLHFDRTGDKGDKGDPGVNGTTPSINVPAIYVREEKAQGTHGTVAPGALNTRVFNTVKLNTMAGASLVGGNVVITSAGVYNFVGSAPALQVNGHQSQLWNVTTGAPIDLGTTEYSPNPSNGSTTRSFVRGQFTLGAGGATISLRHLMGGGSGYLGLAANVATEVYAELKIEKVG